MGGYSSITQIDTSNSGNYYPILFYISNDGYYEWAKYIDSLQLGIETVTFTTDTKTSVNILATLYDYTLEYYIFLIVSSSAGEIIQMFYESSGKINDIYNNAAALSADNQIFINAHQTLDKFLIFSMTSSGGGRFSPSWIFTEASSLSSEYSQGVERATSQNYNSISIRNQDIQTFPDFDLICGCGQVKNSRIAPKISQNQIYFVKMKADNRIDDQRNIDLSGYNSCNDVSIESSSSLYVLINDQSTYHMNLYYFDFSNLISATIKQQTFWFKDFSDIYRGKIDNYFNPYYVGDIFNSLISSEYYQGFLTSMNVDQSCSSLDTGPTTTTFTSAFSSSSFSLVTFDMESTTLTLNDRSDVQLKEIFLETVKHEIGAFCSVNSIQTIDLTTTYSINHIIQDGDFSLSFKSLFDGDLSCNDISRKYTITLNEMNQVNFIFDEIDKLSCSQDKLVKSVNSVQVKVEIPNGSTTTLQIDIDVIDCSLDQYTLEFSIGSLIYTIKEHPQIISLSDFTQTYSQCAKPLIYLREDDNILKPSNLISLTQSDFVMTISSSNLISYDSDFNVFTVETDSIQNLGTYEITIKTILNDLDQTFSESFKWNLNVIKDYSQGQNLYSPQFEEDLKPIEVRLGQSYVYNFPKIIDLDGDSFEVKVKQNIFYDFIRVDSSKITITPGDNVEPGLYVVDIKVIDNGQPPLDNSYKIQVHILDDEASEDQEDNENQDDDQNEQDSETDYDNQQQEEMTNQFKNLFQAFVAKQNMNGEIFIKINDQFKFNQEAGRFIDLYILARDKLVITFQSLRFQRNLQQEQIGTTESDSDDQNSNNQKINNTDEKAEETNKNSEVFILECMLPKQVSKVHLPLFDIDFPANAYYLITYLINLTNVRILPENQIFNFSENLNRYQNNFEIQLDAFFQLLGYETLLILIQFKDFLVLLTIGVFYMIINNFKKLNEKVFSEKYSTLYENMNTKKKLFAYYLQIFLIRRIIFALCISLFEIKNDLGWVFCGLIISNILLNFMVLIFVVGAQIYQYAKRKIFEIKRQRLEVMLKKKVVRIMCEKAAQQTTMNTQIDLRIKDSQLQDIYEDDFMIHKDSSQNHQTVNPISQIEFYRPDYSISQGEDKTFSSGMHIQYYDFEMKEEQKKEENLVNRNQIDETIHLNLSRQDLLPFIASRAKNIVKVQSASKSNSKRKKNIQASYNKFISKF
ncbi:UNKNOWN [Stylonychia lemnae]|uniref:Cadg domain containing protein n=1 Tax=Stylonychia lemnae TaxID=5949 RepID=A0A077ZSX5_STYLE|nr:UNKNOWN [Stylonychia lemnae]|eukprot:CDW72987.1 UNKNOWN [Stylonychia lemnae]